MGVTEPFNPFHLSPRLKKQEREREREGDTGRDRGEKTDDSSLLENSSLLISPGSSHATAGTEEWGRESDRETERGGGVRQEGKKLYRKSRGSLCVFWHG